MNDDMETIRKRRRSMALGVCLLLVLFCLTAIFAARIRTVDVASSYTADVVPDLPAKVGNWSGEHIYYCQKEQCMRSFPESELNGSLICPVCEGRLDQVSLGERNILPADTIISRRLYQDEKGGSITVTIVLSGSEQKSIHRPQQCLPAQGFAIENSSVLTVPLEGRPPLKLTMIRARSGGGAQVKPAPEMLMAYWFAGGGHETHDHFQRIAFMAWDNLIHGIRPRWAYVSLQTSVTSGEQASASRLTGFVRQLYPLLKPNSAAAQ